MQHAVKAGIVHADLLRQLLARLGRTGEQVEGKPARGNTTLTLNLRATVRSLSSLRPSRITLAL